MIEITMIIIAVCAVVFTAQNLVTGIAKAVEARKAKRVLKQLVKGALSKGLDKLMDIIKNEENDLK